MRPAAPRKLIATVLEPSRAAPREVALTITAIGVAACGGDDGDEAGTTAVPGIERDSVGGGAGGEPILIKTQATIPTGEVLSGSSIGYLPFCLGGTFTTGTGAPMLGWWTGPFAAPAAA